VMDEFIEIFSHFSKIGVEDNLVIIIGSRYQYKGSFCLFCDHFFQK